MINLLRQTTHAQKARKFLERFAVNIPFSANQLTLSSILFAIIGFFTIYYNQLLSGFFLFLVAGFLDALDGAVARAKKQKTNLGFFLDGLSDRVVEFLFLLSFLFLPFPNIDKELTLFVLLFFSLIIPYMKAYADHSRALSHEKALKMSGLFERSERLIFFYLILVFFIGGYGNISSKLLLLSVLLTFLTFLQRFYYVLKQHSKKINGK